MHVRTFTRGWIEMFNKIGYKERQMEMGVRWVRSRSWGMLCTSRCELSALAGAAVIVSVLGAELGASVGEAARPSCSATEALGMKAGLRRAGIEF